MALISNRNCSTYHTSLGQILPLPLGELVIDLAVAVMAVLSLVIKNLLIIYRYSGQSGECSI